MKPRERMARKGFTRGNNTGSGRHQPRPARLGETLRPRSPNRREPLPGDAELRRIVISAAIQSIFREVLAAIVQEARNWF